MLHLFYQYYQTEQLSIREISALEHKLGRQLLLQGLSEVFHLDFSPAELEQELSFGINGKPFLTNYPECHFNITHCDGLVICGFDTHSLGIDAEKPGYFAEILVKKALAPAEKETLNRYSTSKELRQEIFFRFWTLKEAYVKMTGTGVDVSLTDFFFTFDDHIFASDKKTGQIYSYSVTCSNPEVFCRQIVLDCGHIVSICSENPENDSILTFVP